jgi:Uma2 family endonuclease
VRPFVYNKDIDLEEGTSTMAALPKQRYSPQEYLTLDRASEFKHEYSNGDVFMMTGASREHNIITAMIYPPTN